MSRKAGDGTIGFPAQKELNFDGGDGSSTDKETGFNSAAQQAIRQLKELHSKSEKLWQMKKYKKVHILSECESWKKELKRSVRTAKIGIRFDNFVGAEAALMANLYIAKEDVPYQPRGLFEAKQGLEMMLQTSSLFQENPDDYTKLKDITVRFLHVLDHLIDLVRSNFPLVYKRVHDDTIEGENGADWGGIYDPMPTDFNSDEEDYPSPVLLY